MNRVPVRLGPLSLLLAVIVICLTTLSVLSFSQAQADLNLAEKQAQTAKTRCELENRGQLFLSEVYEALDEGNLAEGDIEKIIAVDDMTLSIALTVEGDTINVTSWRIQKEWAEKHETMDNLWSGVN